VSTCPQRRQPQPEEMRLREYQVLAENATFQKWADGVRSVLVVMATGCGKTFLFSHIIKRLGKRAIVLCERRELVEQTAQEIRDTTGLTVGIEMGEHKIQSDRDLFGLKYDVIVSSIQTQTTGGDGGGRMWKFDPEEFELLVIDECHHSLAATYRKALDFYKKNPKLKVLGVTATPSRLDELALGQIFDEVAFEYPLMPDENHKSAAIKDGWLVPINQQFVPCALDLSRIRTTAGDLNGADLAEVLEAEKPMQQFVMAIFEIVHGLTPLSLLEIEPHEWRNQVKGIKPKRAVAFTRFVNHARMLSDILNRALPGISAYVHGKQETNERRKIISDFKNGKGAIVLCNCNVLGEGYNDDGIEIIFMCAPTKSHQKYVQQVGRGTRPHASIKHKLNLVPTARRRVFEIMLSPKKELLVVDFVGNSGKHKLISVANALAGNYSDEVIELSIRRAAQSGKQIRMDKLMAEVAAELELKKQEENARKAKLIGRSTYKMQGVDPFNVLQIKPAQPRGWDDKKVLKEGSKQLIRNVFGQDPNAMDYATGMSLVKEFYRRKESGECTFGQAKILKKNGLDIHMKMEDAKKAIDEIAIRQGWKSKTPTKLVESVKRHSEIVDESDYDEDKIPF
jgi:superfamily II DNA or RNA helicase